MDFYFPVRSISDQIKLRAVGFDGADIVELVAVVAAAVAANVIADVLNVSPHDHGALDEYAP